jgi:methionine aminopeptidase
MESEIDRTKYYTASQINQSVEQFVLSEIERGIRDVKKLTSIGNDFIKQQLASVYKREKNKFVAFPVSISIGNCVGNYIYEENNDKYNVIGDDTTFKIQFGVNIGGCIGMFSDTYCLQNKQVVKAKTSELFQKLKKICQKTIFSTNTNDTLRQLLEIECNQYGYKPLINNVSYQGEKNEISFSESKYILLNPKKEYDLDGNVISHPNDCFEFEENEVYHMSIQLVADNDEIHLEQVQKHKAHICRFNEYYFSFKTKSAKEFYNTMKKQCECNAFSYLDISENPAYKIGKRECLNSGILEEFPVYYLKENNNNVYCCGFTVIVGKRCGYLY